MLHFMKGALQVYSTNRENFGEGAQSPRHYRAVRRVCHVMLYRPMNNVDTFFAKSGLIRPLIVEISPSPRC